MRVAILNLTTPFAEIAHLSNAGRMIEAWLAPALPEAELSVHDISLGAPLPGLESFDGLVLSGSELGVYDASEWMAPLRRLMLAARDGGKSMVGICFGHQLMADTFGGKAEKSPGGFVVGVRRFEQDDGAHDAYAWHQDQVVEVPPGARLVGQAAHCPIGALAYDFAGYSVQYHPEYRADTITREIEHATRRKLDRAVADRALASIREVPVDPALAAARSADTLRAARVTT